MHIVLAVQIALSVIVAGFFYTLPVDLDARSMLAGVGASAVAAFIVHAAAKMLKNY